MTKGQHGDAIRDLQRRLGAAGFLQEPSGPGAGRFEASTEAALCEFQRKRGLRVDGRCDANTWASLVESSWVFGTRPLTLTSPNTRGDDVGELQACLTRLGFDSGRVDGIFGPDTAAALRAFQLESGLVVDGICGPATARAILRVSSQTGSGPGIAAVRERERMRALGQIGNCRVVLGQFGGLSGVTRALTHELRLHGAQVLSLDEPDPVLQALTANAFDADVFIGLEPSAGAQALIHFYQVPSFESAGGRALAEHLAHELLGLDGLVAEISGKRLPVLRETRMPAVLCVIGPPRAFADAAAPFRNAVIAALHSWLSRAE